MNLDAVISGAGQSAVGRRLMRDPLGLTVDAVLTALADAGLTTGEVDGIATYPGGIDQPPGFAGGIGVAELQDALRFELDWYAGGIESPGQLGAIVQAALAVHAGLARHVVCFRTVCEASAQGTQGRSAVMSRGEVGGFMQWLAPFGAPSAAVYVAMLAARHFHEYGTTREQLAQIALTCRANAALNPAAVYRDPLSLDDYLAARMISEPLCLFDCDVPADGSTAIVVSRADSVADLAKSPIRFEAIGTALHGRAVRDQWEDLTTMGCRDAAAMLWRHTELTPIDVDVAQLYDGFSFMALAWLEALGFCGAGEGGPFVEGGGRIARTGELPLNTGGGQLSAGRLHGFGHVHEAVRQLWGEGDARQVAGEPEVAVVGNGGPNAGCLLLTRG
jgi:acetyl-CoA acetyltransferase